MGIDPAGRSAILPGVVIPALGDRRDCGGEIGIGQHNHRGLAAQFEVGPLDGGRDRFHDLAPGRNVSGERDHSHPGMSDQPRADSGAISSHHVDYACGQEFGADFGQPQCRKRGMFAGFEDNRVPGRDHRGDLPAGHHQRVIPWRDPDANPQRIAPQHRGEAGPVLASGNPRHGPRGPGKKAEHVDRIADIYRFSRADRLAAIGGFQRSEFVGQCFDPVSDLEHPQRSLFRRHP